MSLVIPLLGRDADQVVCDEPGVVRVSRYQQGDLITANDSIVHPVQEITSISYLCIIERPYLDIS